MGDEKDISEYWGSRLEGDRVPFKDLIDHEIVVLNFEERPSDYYDRNYAIIAAELEGKPITTTTTGGAVLGSLRYLKEHGGLPGRVRCKVVYKKSNTGRMMYALVSAKGVEVEKIGE